MRKCMLLLILALLAVVAVAEPMPDFRLPNEKDKTVALEDLLGKGPLLVDFWADYCQPCKLGMVKLDELAQKYDSLTVVLVSVDAPKMQAKAKNYIKSKNYDFVTLYDPSKTLANKLGVTNPPHTFIVDNAGEIVWSHLGFESGVEREYEAQIRQLLGLAPLEAADEEEAGCGE